MRNTEQTNYQKLHQTGITPQQGLHGQRIMISQNAKEAINKLPSFSKTTLTNKLGRLATRNIPQVGLSTHYIELMRSFLQLKLSKNNPTKVLQIESAKEIEKPKPLLPSTNSEPYRINQYPKTEYKKRILRTHHKDEFIIKNNEISVREAVDLQTLRVREYTNLMKQGEHTNHFWADVIYGINDRPFDWLDYEALFLSAIFPVYSTKVLAKNYYGAGFKTSVDKVLRNHAIIIGHPGLDDKTLQKELGPNAYPRDQYLKKYFDDVQRWNTDVVIRIDNEMNIHRFYRNGKYEFIELS